MSVTFDNSTSFKSHEMANFYEKNGIKIHYVLPYGWKGAGVIENRNGQTRQALALEMEDGKDFIQAYADTTNYLNRRPTNNPVLCPYELFHGKARFSFLNKRKDGLVNVVVAGKQYRLSKVQRSKREQPKQEIKDGDHILVKATFTGPVDKQEGKYLNQVFKVVKREGHRIRYRSLDDNEKIIYECHVKYVRKCYSTDHPLLNDLTRQQKDRLWGNIYHKDKCEENIEGINAQAEKSGDDTSLGRQLHSPNTSVGEMEMMKTNKANQVESDDSCKAAVGTTIRKSVLERG